MPTEVREEIVETTVEAVESAVESVATAAEPSLGKALGVVGGVILAVGGLAFGIYKLGTHIKAKKAEKNANEQVDSPIDVDADETFDSEDVESDK